MSIRAMAEALNVPASTYAAYEDPKKFKKSTLPFDLAVRMAEVLSDLGHDVDPLFELAGMKSMQQLATERDRDPGALMLAVKASVAAGVWHEHVEWPEDQWEIVHVPPSPVPGGERFALRMEGRSMDKTILPDSILECLRVAFGFVEPVPGDIVVVERTQHNLVEMTCKRLARDGDEWVAVPESSLPEFSEPIHLGKPDENVFTDIECRIVGIVLRAHRSFWSPERAVR